MIERRIYPLGKSLSRLYKVYIAMAVSFGTWAYFHGHLLSYAYREELGISKFNVPIDIVKTEIYGGIEILLDHYKWIVTIFFFPILILLLHWVIFDLSKGKIKPHNWLIKPNQIVSYVTFFLLFIVLLVPIFIIRNPINEGIKKADEFIRESNSEQLIINSNPDSVVNCKVIYFDKDYVVFMRDSTAYAMSLPNGSYVISNILSQ